MEGERPAAGDGRIVSPGDFEAAFLRHFPPVYRFIAARVGSAVAEDLAAETFATAYRRRGSFEPGRGSLRSWLYGIAVNLVRSHWRAEQHLLALDARLVPEVDLSDDSEAADQRVAASLLAPRLAAALGQLTGDQREVVLLYAAGLSHEEIAAALQIVRARRGRGCRGPGRCCASSSAGSTLTCGCSTGREPIRREEGRTVVDEIELLRRFIDEIPGPSTDAWARARAAIAAARAEEEPAGHRPKRKPGRRRRRLLAITAGAAGAAAVGGLLAVLLAGSPVATGGQQRPGAGSPWSVGSTVTWAYQGSLKTSAFTAAGQPVFSERTTHAAGRSETVAVIYPNATWWRATAAPPAGRAPACPSGITPGLTIISRWAAFIRDELRCGGYRMDGRQRVDGIDAVKLTGGKALVALWVSPATYLPVRAISGLGRGRAQTDFRWLSPAQASLSQLSVRVPAGFRQIPPPS